MTEDDLGPYLGHAGIEVDLTPLNEAIETVLEEFERGDAKIDKALAPTVHRTLDLSRREAAIAGIWHYLTVLVYPELVRHRQGHVNNVREKFLEGGEDIYSNAIHRLWWIAEITRDGDGYSRTEAILEMQELANDVSDLWFARHKPITYACVDVLQKSEIEDMKPSNSEIVSKTTTQLREKLTIVCAEGLDYPKAVELVTQIRDDVVEDL